MLMATTLFPHLDHDATWTMRQEAGDRMRAVYAKDAAKVQAAIIGGHNVWLGDQIVCRDLRVGPGCGKAYTIGLSYAHMMGRALIAYRVLARQRDHDRAHYIKNALRLRRSLCCWGLSLER